MKKYVYISLIALFGVCACKSSHSIEKNTDAVSVQKVHVSDTLHTDFSFLFDQLDMWCYDSLSHDSDAAPRSKMVKHICITGGQMRNTKTEHRLKQLSDSTQFKAQEVIHPINTPPKLWHLIILILAIILVFTICRPRQ